MIGVMIPWGVATLVIVGTAMVLSLSPSAGGGSGDGEGSEDRRIELPAPTKDGSFSLEKAIEERRSHRSFEEEPLSLADVGQILWAAQGVTDKARGYRAAPSAGATYPLDTYLVAGDVDDLPSGIYRYVPREHALEQVSSGDSRKELREAALGQSWVESAGASVVFSGVYARTTERYGRRGERYTHMEAGHAAQNAYLQATALGLGMVAIGAFEDRSVRRLLDLRRGEEPLYILPFGPP